MVPKAFSLSPTQKAHCTLVHFPATTLVGCFQDGLVWWKSPRRFAYNSVDFLSTKMTWSNQNPPPPKRKKCQVTFKFFGFFCIKTNRHQFEFVLCGLKAEVPWVGSLKEQKNVGRTKCQPRDPHTPSQIPNALAKSGGNVFPLWRQAFTCRGKNMQSFECELVHLANLFFTTQGCVKQKIWPVFVFSTLGYYEAAFCTCLNQGHIIWCRNTLQPNRWRNFQNTLCFAYVLPTL